MFVKLSQHYTCIVAAWFIN